MILYWLIIREKRNTYTSNYLFLTRILASFVDMLFYYFASKIFKPAPDAGVLFNSLFFFSISGQIFMAIGLDGLVSAMRNIKLSVVDGTFDMFLLSPKPYWRVLLMMQFSNLVVSFISIAANFVILNQVFGFEFPLTSIPYLIVIQVVFLPMFIGLGIVSGSLFIIFKRGTAIFGTFITSLGVLSGVYYPITAYPDFVQVGVKFLSPFYYLLEISRRTIVSGGMLVSDFKILSMFSLVSIVSFFAGILFLNFSLIMYRKKGEAFIFTQ